MAARPPPTTGKLPGFVASNFNGSGKGGGNYFAKYASPELAQAAIKAVEGHGIRPVVARQSLDTSKLRPPASGSAYAASPRS